MSESLRSTLLPIGSSLARLLSSVRRNSSSISSRLRCAAQLSSATCEIPKSQAIHRTSQKTRFGSRHFAGYSIWVS
jgi:hypothetical protein